MRRTALFRRSFSRDYPRAVRAEGVYLWDDAGRRYLDFSGSAAVNLIGHGDASVARAMAEQAAALEFVHSSQFVTPIAEEFAAELLESAGASFRGGAVYFTSGGSEATETALKLARQYQVEVGHPERCQVLSRDQSYHGSTFGALSVSGNRSRREIYLPMVREFEHIATPYCYRCKYGNDCSPKYAQELEGAIARTNGQAAAFIFEPVGGATLGAAVPPDGYLPRIAEICRAHGLLMIADEVMTGCGRTGGNFAVDHWNVHPDILVLGKGISSGYAPLGAVIANERVVDAIAQGSGAFVHGFTYNAHPVAVAAGRAAICRARALGVVGAVHGPSTSSSAAALSTAMKSLAACNPVGDVRGTGFLWGVEFVHDRASKEPFPPAQRFALCVAEAAASLGVLVYPMQGCIDGRAGDHLLIAPPAIITREEIDWAIAQLAEAIVGVAP